METEFLSPVDLQSSSLPGPLQERIQHLPHTFTPEAWKSLFTPYFLAFIFLSLWLKPRPIPPLSSIWSKHTASFTISQFYITISTVSAFEITVPASGFSCLSTFSEDTLAAVSHKGPHGYHRWPLTSQECMSFVDGDLQHLALSFFLYSTHSGPPSNFCFCSILVPFSFPRMCSSPLPRVLSVSFSLHLSLRSPTLKSSLSTPAEHSPQSITRHFSFTPLIFQVTHRLIISSRWHGHRLLPIPKAPVLGSDW